MNNERILAHLERLGAIITDSHFVYTSGEHGSAYINKDAAYVWPQVIREICDAMADPFLSDDVETVVGPAIGGVILATRVAESISLRTNKPVASVFAEEHDQFPGRVFKRGYDAHVTGKRVLVVEDILNTGGSVRDVVRAVWRAGGTVVGVSAICNRGGVTLADIDNPPKLVSLVNVSMARYPEDDCPLCRDNVEINTTVGKGAQFLARKARP